MFFETKEYINNENPGAIKKIIVEDSNTVWMQTQYSLYKIRLIKDGSKYRKHTVSIEPMNAYKEVICKKDEHHLLLTGRDNYLHSYDIRTKIFQKISTSEIWKILISKKINQSNQLKSPLFSFLSQLISSFSVCLSHLALVPPKGEELNQPSVFLVAVHVEHHV